MTSAIEIQHTAGPIITVTSEFTLKQEQNTHFRGSEPNYCYVFQTKPVSSLTDYKEQVCKEKLIFSDKTMHSLFKFLE